MPAFSKKEALEIAHNYDAIICSFLSDTVSWKIIADEINPTKKFIRIYLPHGNSDKGFNDDRYNKYEYTDITCYYGDQMLQALRAYIHHDCLVRLGHFRYVFYQKNKVFFDSMLYQHALSNFKKDRKTLLYCPTWQDASFSTTVFEVLPYLLKYLPEHYNLIVKLHPDLLIKSNSGALFMLIAQYENNPRVAFVEEIPYIMPLLEIADIYLGDMSSVGYDFLAFDKPMVFFPSTDLKSHLPELFYAGKCIYPENYKDIYPIIDSVEKDAFKTYQQELYRKAFGQRRDATSIKDDLDRIVSHCLISSQ